jgi:hypothetical protein
VFHVNLLKEVPKGAQLAEDAPDENSNEYEVERICKHKGKGNKHQFLVQWKGYGAKERTWEFRKNLTNCEDLLKDYLGQINP